MSKKAGPASQQQPTGPAAGEAPRQPPAGEARQAGKRVKREAESQPSPQDPPLRPQPPRRAPQAAAPEQPPPKRPRGARDAPGAGEQGGAVRGAHGGSQLAAAPSPARAAPAGNGVHAPGSLPRRSLRSIAWPLSEIRTQLEAIADVEGVRELMDQFPACVMVGSIANNRELVAALLGDHGIAGDAAAVLVAPGMRQPVAMELRCGEERPFSGPEAEEWLRSVKETAQKALGQRLKTEPLRLRLCTVGCANLDVVQLPEKKSQDGGVQQKIEDMRVRYLGSTSNLLVCLEPGAPVDLCRRFDPELRRTVLLGAAAASARGGDGQPSASELCGPLAARELEHRFDAFCRERVPQWMATLERLEKRLEGSRKQARETEKKESPVEMIMKARAAGNTFSRALPEVVGGAPSCESGALTLEEELAAFAQEAARGLCGVGASLSSQDAADAAADLYAQFQGVEGYSAYLRDSVRIAGADVPLNGGAAWQRLLAEVEVAMRLSHPPPEELRALMGAAVRCGGTGVHGHQRWEGVSSKLMLSVAHGPLHRRIRYVASRVAWVLKRQKTTVCEWMSSVAGGPASRLHSPLFAEHVEVMRAFPMVRELVFGAYNDAASSVGENLLKNLKGTLTAGCINPQLVLQPATEPVFDAARLATPMPPKAGRADEARKRVVGEMRRRSGSSGGLPLHLQDRVFEPRDAGGSLPFVEARLRKAFGVLADTLANQAFAFADTSMSSLCRRHVDEAMCSMDFSPEQRRALEARHAEHQAVASQVEARFTAVRHCLSTLRALR